MQIKEEFPHLVHGNIAFARKMGFPEVILPGDVRNDLYLTLVYGEFSKGTKTSDKNIEVSVAVCNEKGAIVPNVMALGAGAAMLDVYKSVIYYHEYKPKWNETFRVSKIKMRSFIYNVCITVYLIFISFIRFKCQLKNLNSAI